MRKTKIRQLALFFIISILLSGCQLFERDTNAEYSILFKKNIEVNFKEKNVDTCEFVANVDGTNINKSSIDKKKKKIYVSNYAVVCGDIDTSKMGETTITYKIKDKSFQTKVMIKDLQKPTINMKKTSFELTEGDVLDVLSYAEAMDNVDKKDVIKLTVSGSFDTSKVGTYDVLVVAIDKAKNKATVSVKIVVKEKPKEEPKEEDNSKNNNSENNQNGSSNQNGNSNGSNHDTQPTKPSAYTKFFLFSEGYTFSTAPETCQKELMDVFSKGGSGSCTQVNDASGMPSGQKLTVY